MSRRGDLKILDLDEAWDIINKYILKLISTVEEGNLQNVVSVADHMELYLISYKLGGRNSWREPNRLKQIYKRYKQSLKMYFTSRVFPALREKEGEAMLIEFVRRWGIHREMVPRLSNLFSYLEDTLLQFMQLKRSVSEDAHMYFRKFVFDEMRINVRDAVFTLIREDRQGEQIDRTLLNDVLCIFVEIGKDYMDLYRNEIEVPMLEYTVDYYSQKTASWSFEENSCMDYLLKAGECMKHEEDIATHYLHRSRDKVLEIVQNELLSHYKTQLLENLVPSCCSLLRDENKLDLAKLYSMFCRIPEGLQTLVNTFKEHVIREGTPLVMRALNAITDKTGRRDIGGVKEEAAFVYTVLELYDKYVDYIIYSFRRDAPFYRALKEAFEEFCNKKVAGSTSEEFLATLCDIVLKKGGSCEKLRYDEIEGILANVTKFLEYVSDRDLFAEFYRRKLAARLLYDRKSTHDIHELSMLSKLKQQFGNQFTSKMGSMVRDMLQAQANQTSFEAYLTSNPNIHRGIKFDVRVLNFAFWPTFKSSEPSLPLEMIKCVHAFKEFYSTHTKHRQLTWLYSTGTCNVMGKFHDEPIELIVTPYYAILLLLFNSSQKLSYVDIKSQLNLRDADLIRMLHSIVFGKYKILLKDPETKEIYACDSFQINYSFTNRRRKIKILLPSENEKKKVIENVDMDREQKMNALIIRIMKRKKYLDHEQLINDCIEHHGGRTFKIDVQVLKNSIEKLITREYLERDKQNFNILRYVP
jgi:cullin 1